LSRHGPCPIHRRSFAPVAQGALALEESAIQATGECGESMAEEHVRGLGWEVLDVRFRCPGGELDIVAREDDTIVFAEVKARRTAGFGATAEAVNARKRARITHAATTYLRLRGLDECPCRFDVIEVVFDPFNRT